MANNFIVNFRSTKKQIIDKGSVVTYADELRLDNIKSNLAMKTDFFVVTETENSFVKISNGFDNVETTSEQLIEVRGYLEELPDFNPPLLGEPSYFRGMLKWKEMDDMRKSYPIMDNYLGILAEGILLSDEDFVLEFITRGDKQKIYAALIPERISDYLDR